MNAAKLSVPTITAKERLMSAHLKLVSEAALGSGHPKLLLNPAIRTFAHHPIG
jgi:hypothetical protein